MEVPGLCATWVSLVHSYKAQDRRVICGSMFLFSLTRFSGTSVPSTDSLPSPEGLWRDQDPSPRFPAALKDPMHLRISCCTVPRATAAWAFPGHLPHPEARELREHRLLQCSLLGNQKEWQAERVMRIVVLQMGVGGGEVDDGKGREVELKTKEEMGNAYLKVWFASTVGLHYFFE